MVTQKTLKEIRHDLKATFSMFNTYNSVASFVEAKMKSRYFFSVYNDKRCSDIYSEAITELEADVNSKYNKIANKINEFIDGLKDTFEAKQCYGFSNDDSFKRAAIGAGVGLTAALVLGTPIGWFAALGVAVATLVDSKEKKRELISRIRSIADKLNNEAISKLSDILDLYIVEDEILLSPNVKEKIIDEPIIEYLSLEQQEIKKFLNDRNIKYLVHFTDASHVDSILINGICSPKEGERRGIKITVNDNGISAHKADRYMNSTPDDYISLTITSMNEKVLSAYKARKGIKKCKRILIDANILWREIDRERIYCNMNSSSGSLICGKDLEALESMFAPYVEQTKYNGEKLLCTRDQKPDNVTTHEQAEILFLSYVDPKYFIDEEEECDTGEDTNKPSNYFFDIDDNDLPF